LPATIEYVKFELLPESASVAMRQRRLSIDPWFSLIVTWKIKPLRM
jgi:hypothetical protein